MKNLARIVLALAPLTGCDRVFGLGDQPGTMDAPGADAPISLCAGGEYAGNGGLLGVCLDAMPPDQLAYDAEIDTGDVTGAGAECTTIVTQPDGTEACVIAAQHISITAQVRAIGTRPLVLLALEDLELTGSLDASSNVTRGAGGGHATCTHGLAIGTAAGTGGGGGGGAGGTFGAIGGGGGAGGLGTVDSGSTTQRAAGGTPAPVGALEVVRGGCRGSRGGDGPSDATGSGPAGGLGAHGGGGVYLIAGRSIRIAGLINASGAGGNGGQPSSSGGMISSGGGGGGGGGSGGLIGLDAPTITVEATARVVANGGGGGGGGGATAGGDGALSDPADSFPFPAAGAARNEGGSGGAGGHADQQEGLAGADGADSTASSVVASGGGGGGGGVGHVVLYAASRTTEGALISPAPPVR